MNRGEGGRGLTAIVISLADDPRLIPCLEALAAQAPPDLELAVVENAAAGAPPELPLPPALRVRRAANPGFAASAEEAVRSTRGAEVLFLNPDCRLLPGALERARAALGAEADVGGVAFRLLRPEGEILDSAGIRLGFLRRARDRGMGRPAAGRHLVRESVDAACLAGALFDRRALLAARDGAGEVIDTRFFAYKEDVDLGWRLRRAGFRILYEPEARAVHERGWREGARRGIPLRLRRLSLRNRWLCILKNESLAGMIVRLPFFVLSESVLAGWLLAREARVLAGYAMILSEFGATLARRGLWEDGKNHGRV